MSVMTIALNTFRETIRNRILLNILLFAIGLILLSLVVGEWSMNNQIRVIKDFGLSAMSIFGLLIAIFIGIRLMVQELEQRTIYVLASKPINRWQIVVGKYLGLGLTLAANVVLMSLTLAFTNLVMEGTVDLGMIPAIGLLYVEILLIVAFALFFSTIMSPTLASLSTFAIFTIGHITDFLREYTELYPDKGFHGLLKAIYYIMPNLENLNLKMAAVGHLERPPHAFEYGLLYGTAYIGIVLLLSVFAFNRKDFK